MSDPDSILRKSERPLLGGKWCLRASPPLTGRDGCPERVEADLRVIE